MKTWQEISTASDSLIIEWAESQPWCAPMRNCQQDPQWHAEGDVWTHTRMVLDELLQLDEYADLPRHEQIVLLLTAIFHDSGKPATTIVEESTGRIRSPKHAAIGTRIARRQLMEIGCPLEIREHVCHLVLFHGRPPYLGSNRSAADDVIRVSTFLCNRMLYLFALADTRGRICTSSENGNPEEILELWKLESQELNCFDSHYEFSNDHARFLYYRSQLDNLHYQPFEDFRCRMTLTSGLPGAGKDNWLEENRGDLPVVSLDSIRRDLKVDPKGNQGVVIQKAKEMCRHFLRDRVDFAVSATNVTRQIRQLWIDLGASYNARIEIAYVEPPLGVIYEQNRSREGIDAVPAKVIDRLISKLDPPTLAECHELIVATDHRQ
ncbi:AAA family ATPase [Mariniblastus fucicola]|uniref:HD domain-containing protein n=1 Tax=Mariniblastus fucicola TaxID=980251 RepID=A0A5B9PRX1_9BACT|nr:AAA family ATPase [Mariniblastus fucicola]QEG25261.1 hypothetical protein MFFC18_51850 [Mariniblastus fucicola]